jgi:hypothetical protein
MKIGVKSEHFCRRPCRYADDIRSVVKKHRHECPSAVKSLSADINLTVLNNSYGRMYL